MKKLQKFRYLGTNSIEDGGREIKIVKIVVKGQKTPRTSRRAKEKKNKPSGVVRFAGGGTTAISACK